MSDKAMREVEGPWERMPPHERYHVDPLFHAVVAMLYSQMVEAKWTPTELREACHLAACMYEEQHVRPIFIDPKRPFKWNVREG